MDAAVGAFFSAGHAQLRAEGVVELLPHAERLPLGEIVVDQAPLRKIMGPFALRTAAFRDMEDRIEHQAPLVARRAPQFALGGQQLGQDLPFYVGHIRGISRGISRGIRFGFRQPELSTLL